MPMQQYHDVVQDLNGNALPGASVKVVLRSSGALATIYSDGAATMALTNPLTADGSGRIAFYAADGDYHLTLPDGSALNDVTLFAGAQRETSPYKLIATTIDTDNTLNDDPHLELIGILPNEHYEFWIVGSCSSVIAAGIQFAFSIPAAPTWSFWHILLYDTATIRINATGTMVTAASLAGGVAALAGTPFVAHALLYNGANGGDVHFQWAQHTSNGGNTTVWDDSFMVTRKVA